MSIKVLIADDEPNQLELLSFNLTEAGFQVVRAYNGQEALTIAREETPDILVLDWMMPLMSGVDVCRQLRADHDTRHMPIIMLSARGEEGDKTLGLDNGADDYMSKPFSPRELVSRIKALLRRSKPVLMEQELRFHGLVLNTSQMIVTRDGNQIALGPKEFKILAILMERPGQVYSRSQLLDMVWGHGVYVEERTVDVHLSRLRKALRTIPGADAELPDLVRTVRGSGYAMVVPVAA